MFKALGKLIKLAFVLGLLVIIGGVCTAIFVTADPAPERQPQPSVAYTAPERPQASPSGPGRPGASASPEKRPAAEPEPLVAHTVEDEKVDDTSGVYKVTMQVSMAAKPTERQLRAVLMHLFRQARNRGRGMAFDRPNAVYIFAYAKPRYHAGSGPSFVARLMFNENNGDKKPEIDIVEDLLATMFEPDEDRFGLSEEQRKEVYYKLVEAEDRADKKAGIDDPEKYDGDKAERLKQKYDERICNKYKITGEQATKIVIEGTQKGWPMPPTE
ncbi:MAG: hypothetical protein H6818_06810 [Phycisphaerales bacterium]|nr:hypothetical protein [Phycisphaerales bacterium]MCB9864867.1 hypothetical protein [Phycisphaerales bacterium]